MESGHRRAEALSDRPTATSPLRMVGYAAVLTAAAFSQSGGAMVADTKFDLLTDPGRFLAKATSLWDPIAAFGQIQNQAYGYAWPMGPFFWLGETVGLPDWAVQRLWWSLLLCLAFFGILRLARALGLGTPGAQVLAAFAYVLTPRLTTLVGATSVEVWPMALAPWVLVPLVIGSERGSPRRAAALSALVVASCGGVNAIAVSAVLPLGVIWLVTRARGPRQWRLLGWWTLFTGLATFWWWGPLLMMGRYSPPFLDYIENATTTTLPTDLTKTLLGNSDWVAYFAGIDFPAGHALVTTPFLALDAAAVAALGLAGIAAHGSPHRRFLALGVLVGAVLVGFGYAGDLAGFWAGDRAASLDGVLAPFRNLHKFDVVLRIPLVLGLAQLLARLPSLFSGRLARRNVTMLRMVSVLVIGALALPWVDNQIPPRDGIAEVPDYWREAADYLHDTDDGTVSLIVPAAAFGVYTWGNVHDDVMQGLARSPWAVRNVIPLAEPGNVVLLDEVTSLVESGRPSASLAPLLAANGVGRLVVRNDLDRFQTGAPDPTYVRQALEASPGLSLAVSLGPTVGEAPVGEANDGTRLVYGDGASIPTGSVDIYDVDAAAAATVGPLRTTLVGDPGSQGQEAWGALGADDRVLTADLPDGLSADVVLTDGMKRREKNFASVRFNESNTLPADGPFRLSGPEHRHRILADQDSWETTESWRDGVLAVLASTSQSQADAPTPIDRGSHPGAALDHDPQTAWRSSRQLEPVGQWWQEDFDRPHPVTGVTVRLSSDSAPVERLTFSTETAQVTLPAPAPGEERSYVVNLAAGPHLRVTAAGDRLGLPGSLGLAEVVTAGLSPQRYLVLPAPQAAVRVAGIAVARDQERSACSALDAALVCNDALVAPGEDGDTLARVVTLPYDASFRAEWRGSLRRSTAAGAALLRTRGLSITAPANDVADVGSSPSVMADGDAATTWISPGRASPTVDVELPRRVRLREIRVSVNPGAAAAAPSLVELRHGRWSQRVSLDAKGSAAVAGPRLASFSMRIIETTPAYSVDGQQFVRLPPGVSELELNGKPLTPWGNGQPVDFPCGTGPVLEVDGVTTASRVRAVVGDLLRGGSVDVLPCSTDTVALRSGENTLAAHPSALFRVDTLTLAAEGSAASPARSTPVDVRRDAGSRPRSVEVPAASEPQLLALAQNHNPGWSASLDGRRLAPVRVNGWAQGWIVPEGASGQVVLRYLPEQRFRLLLLVGAALALLVLVAAAAPARAVSAPALSPGRPGLLDLMISLAAGGILGGVLGLALAAAAWAVAWWWPRFGGWPMVSGVALMIASLSVAWDQVSERSWALELGQTASLAAVFGMAAAVAAERREPSPAYDSPVTEPPAAETSPARAESAHLDGRDAGDPAAGLVGDDAAGDAEPVVPTRSGHQYRVGARGNLAGPAVGVDLDRQPGRGRARDVDPGEPDEPDDGAVEGDTDAR